MTLQRIFLVVTILLFGAIGTLALIKKQKNKNQLQTQQVVTASAQTMQPAVQSFEEGPIEIDLQSLSSPSKTKNTIETGAISKAPVASTQVTTSDPLQGVNRIEQLFQKNSPLPIVETIQYKAKVSWKQGRPAWLIDYASHYKTPIDFIARSINERPHYIIKNISDGQSFNILSPNKEFSFYLVIDIARCQLWLYYTDPAEQESVLLKTYRVGLGRTDKEHVSGCLTPLGIYKLGSRIAVFKPKMMGMHRQKRVELMRVFGTRWIPFEREIEGCTEPAKGFGIHGTPWDFDTDVQKLVDNGTGIGSYESDGCIRLKTEDVEELYSIITTRDAFVQIVRSIEQAKLPFKEKTA